MPVKKMKEKYLQKSKMLMISNSCCFIYKVSFMYLYGFLCYFFLFHFQALSLNDVNGFV